jgi:hypothetical protein
MSPEKDTFETVPETMTLDEVARVLENHLGSTRTAYEEIIRELVGAIATDQRDPIGAKPSLQATSIEIEEIARAIVERGGPAWQDLQIRLMEISKSLAKVGG